LNPSIQLISIRSSGHFLSCRDFASAYFAGTAGAALSRLK